MVEPEVVATSPYPIKSRVPVCCGFSSTKVVGERGVGFPSLARWMPQVGTFASRIAMHLQGSQILDLWGLLFPLNHSPKKEWSGGFVECWIIGLTISRSFVHHNNALLHQSITPFRHGRSLQCW